MRVPLDDGSTYLYAVSRSLEADENARAAGIVYDADVLEVEAGFGDFCLLATDGFWDVFDVASAGAKARDMLREKILNVNEIAERLCADAIAQGSVDNVSCVIVLNEK